MCLDKKFQLNPFVPQSEKRLESNDKIGHYILKKDFIRDEKHGILNFVNEEKIARQKRVMSYLFTQIGKNIFTGKSIIGISLPVFIFDQRSFLERYGISFQFAPLYLEK